MLRYTVLRLLVFFGCLLLLWLLGLRSLEQRPWLIVGAALLSMVVSYFVLAPFRQQTIEKISGRVEDRIVSKRGARDEDVEDALTDADAKDADYR